MNIHEYQAKRLLARFGVPIPDGRVAYTAEEADAARHPWPCLVREAAAAGRRTRRPSTRPRPRPSLGRRPHAGAGTFRRQPRARGGGPVGGPGLRLGAQHRCRGGTDRLPGRRRHRARTSRAARQSRSRPAPDRPGDGVLGQAYRQSAGPRGRQAPPPSAGAWARSTRRCSRSTPAASRSIPC